MEKLKQERYIYELFSELIRIAIGRAVCLSHTPTVDEWGDLYAMAKKQSLVGICFAGVQKLQKQRQNPPEFLYLQWMGVAAKIQQRNEVVNQQCADLQKHLSADGGFVSAILKGQDYARYYNDNLANLRQSGDIDLWVKSDMDKIIAYARNKGIEIGHIDIKHSDMCFFADTEVEVHFRPSWMYCPRTDKKFQVWVNGFDFDKFESTETGFVVPPLEFSLVFAMIHIYRHFFSEGIGLRQVLDYYFLLMHSTAAQRHDAMAMLDSLNMRRAVGGIMWIICSAFGLDADMLLCEADAKVGSFLMKEMMTSGNFGHDDNRFKHVEKSKRWQRGWIGLKRNAKFLRYFPEEVLWSPVWKVWHYCWRKRKGYL